VPTWFFFFCFLFLSSPHLFCFWICVGGRNLKLFYFCYYFLFGILQRNFELCGSGVFLGFRFLGLRFISWFLSHLVSFLCISDLDSGFVDKGDNVVSEASRGSNSHKPQRDRTWSGKHKGRREGARALHVQSEEHPLAWWFCLGCMVQLCLKSSKSQLPFEPRIKNLIK